MLVFVATHEKSWVLRYFICRLHEVVLKRAGFSIQNKMSSCEEFFTRLRKLAFTVDKETNELKETLENSENSAYNENRACLLLRETLAEVKDFKVSNPCTVDPLSTKILF